MSPFVINMENEGRLSQRGRFRTNDDDLKALLTNHLPVARERWQLAPTEPMDVAIYAHGGLTDEDARREDRARLGAASLHASDLPDLPDVGDRRASRR